jgi:uncharacterized protein with LGFP repeats
MFSALKRWTKMGGEDSKLSMPSGVKAMGHALQRKFARGVQYNSESYFYTQLEGFFVKYSLDNNNMESQTFIFAEYFQMCSKLS